MKFALVDGKRQEAQPKLSGKCKACGHPMIAKCGEERLRVWHWAHKSRRHCDHWWENETEWHRAWKGQFPVDWQEIVHKDKNGEKHIADVKTEHGWVFEFQHSYIKPKERRVRDAFYQNLVWVVDGSRRKRDIPQFEKAVSEGEIVNAKPKIWSVITDKCALLREWAGCHASAFFDFDGINKPKSGTLWWLLPWSTNGKSYILKVPCTDFIKFHCIGANSKGQDFAEILKKYRKIIIDIQQKSSLILRQRPRQPQSHRSYRPQPRRFRRPESFQQHLRRKRIRRRF